MTANSHSAKSRIVAIRGSIKPADLDLRNLSKLEEVILEDAGMQLRVKNH
jgi:hypothetical protein